MKDSRTLNNKRVAKNTIYLYIRMAITLIVQFYTSRVVLNTLGIDDYGLWNVIASFIVIFAFISGPLTTATQRFLNYEIGSNGEKLEKIFSSSILIFLIIGVILFFILEVTGIWFLNSKINIENEKVLTANWAFQFSVLGFCVNFIRIPYESAIIAEEKMSFYAILCILEALISLGIVYLLHIPLKVDKLIMYGGLTFISKFIVFTCYKFYCNHKIRYTKYNFVYDKNILKEIGSFAGWNTFGALASSSATQGINILINVYFGVSVNAAYGLASQVSAGIKSFVNNFQKAVNPQIVKSYASDDLSRMHKLIMATGKFSFMLLFALVLPIMFNIDIILELWLGKTVPQFTAIFCNLTLIQMLIVCMGDPIDVAIFATGKIKNYQIILSAIIALNIIITYILFNKGFGPISSFVTKCCVEICILLTRLYLAKKNIGLSVIQYIKDVLAPIFFVVLSSYISMVAFKQYVFVNGTGIINLIKTFTCFLPLYFLIVWMIGLNKIERTEVKSIIMKKNKL